MFVFFAILLLFNQTLCVKVYLNEHGLDNSDINAGEDWTNVDLDNNDQSGLIGEVEENPSNILHRSRRDTSCDWHNGRLRPRVRQAVTTVREYADRMESQNSLSTRSVNSASNAIYKYTYKNVNTNSGQVKLPIVVRARILPRHIQASGSRVNANTEAKANCRLMGMNSGRTDRNNDVFGHLISYKNGGPPDFYNIVPQTNRINIGTVTNTPIFAPSIWAASEREITSFVNSASSAYVEIIVAVFYDGAETRPIAFGTSETYGNSSGVVHQCRDYFYSNNPDEDPDSLNG